MMVQVALEPEESEICNVDNRSYIIPDANLSNREPEAVIATDCTNVNAFDKTASSVISLLDVNTFINVTLTLTDDCKTEFSFAVTPRTETIGNLWIGVGFEAISDDTRFDLSNPNANMPTMDGNALIISLLADGINSPLATGIFCIS